MESCDGVTVGCKRLAQGKTQAQGSYQDAFGEALFSRDQQDRNRARRNLSTKTARSTPAPNIAKSSGSKGRPNKGTPNA